MKLKESFMDFPVHVIGEQLSSSCRPARRDTEERQTLKTMSLVHRAWTGPARVALRRRAEVHSPCALKRFLRSPLCGRWVQELHCSMQVAAVRDIVRKRHNNALRSLRMVLERLPNLRALSLDMENSLHSVGPFRLTPILTTIPRGLQVLHIHLQQWTDDSLCELRGVVSNLHSLTALSIMGDCFTADAYHSQSLHVAQTALPPASLKRLLLRFCALNKEVISHLSWLFTPREDYSLRELRIRHNATFLSAGVKDAIGALLPILSPALADLKILEVLISKVAYDGSWTLLFFPKSLQTLLDRCTSLEELEAAFNDTPADEVKLPKSLQRVHIFEVLEDEDSWASDDM